MKIGDKAKVIDKESLLYNKTVELIEVSDEAYIFHAEDKKLKLVVHKDAIQRTIEWESSPDRAKINESKSGTLYGCPGCEKVCNEAEKNTCFSNKMEQVAALFGKKLGEVFSIEFVTGSLGHNRNFASCCCFKADGLFCEDRGPCEIMLNDLLTGRAVILD